MTKESIIELQKIDCNCNDCIFMARDSNKFQESKKMHYLWQLNYFNLIKEKTKDETMRFEFDSSTAMVQYGDCSKFNKPVSFIKCAVKPIHRFLAWIGCKAKLIIILIQTYCFK